ncbi:hypothetical protein MP228_008532 [Amoeboaphelidium protococcarum]|nr:hypothetical protein MP228_008532 [Amoeboaphelidium protococcarum]
MDTAVEVKEVQGDADVIVVTAIQQEQLQNAQSVPMESSVKTSDSEHLQVVTSPNTVVPEVIVEQPRLEDIPPEEVDAFGFYISKSQSQQQQRKSSEALQNSLQASVWTLTTRRVRSIEDYVKLELKWVDVIANFDFYRESQQRRNQVKALSRLGIPVSVRGRVWQLLLNTDTVKEFQTQKWRATDPSFTQSDHNLYQHLIQLCDHPSDSQSQLFEVIMRDIRRSYPDHYLFTSSSSNATTPTLNDLTLILKAYSILNQKVGYCQGMGRVVGMFLMQMPAEDAFWCLVALIDQGVCRDYYNTDLKRIKVHAQVYDKLLQQNLPKLYKHLQRNDVDPLIYCTNWFMTLFTMALPWQVVLRIWDILLNEGTKVIFRTSLAIMDTCQSHLLRKCPSSQELIPFVLHLPHEMFSDADALVNRICNKYSRIGWEICSRLELEILSKDWQSSPPTERK